MKFASFVVVSAALLSGTALQAAVPANIVIDGSQTDWSGKFYFIDRNETSASSGGGTDIPDNYDVERVYFGNNATYIFWGATTYGNISGSLAWQIWLDLNNNGRYDSSDRYVEITTNGTTCQDIRVYNATSGSQVSNRDCGGTSANGRHVFINSTGRFIEGRFPLTWVGLPDNNANIRVGLIMKVAGSGATELAPGQPDPSFMNYDNRGLIQPTFVRVRGLTAEAGEGGVLVRWRTSSEYFSAGTWVVRKQGDDWLPVSPLPQATENVADGGSYAVVDPNGGAGDVYALVEIDSREAVRVFGPVDAIASKVEMPRANKRITVGEALKRRDLALSTHLNRRVSLRDLWNGRGNTGSSGGQLPTLEVDVNREGLYVVCDSDTQRYGGVPVAVSSSAGLSRGFAVSAPCEGLGFYAPRPTSAYAPFEVYRVALASQRGLARLSPQTAAYDGELAPALLTAELMPRIALDWRDGTPNRFFWSYAANTPRASVAVPTISGTADFTFDVHPLGGGSTHTVVVSGAQELGRATVGGGWTTINLPSLPMSDVTELRFHIDAPAEVIEIVLLAEGRLRYRGEPKSADGVARFSADGAAWVGVRGGSGYAFDVTSPLTPQLLTTAARNEHLAVQTAASTREVFVASAFEKLTPALVPSDALFSETNGVEYLVLGPASLESSARELVQLHEDEGMRSAFLSYEAIYARFTGSNPHPGAIKSFLDWTLVSWGATPRYLAMLGSTSADPYGYTGSTRGADSPVVESYDEMLDYRRYSDWDLIGGHAIAVGRIPSSDVAEIGRYIDKLRAYRGSTPNGRWTMVNGAMSERDPSFVDLVGNIGNQVSELYDVQRLTVPTPEDLVNAWGGADVIAYAGHGDVESWADDVLYAELAPNLVTERPPVTLSSACMEAMTTSMTGGLAWSLVSAEVGRGSIAAIAPTSIVEPIKATEFLGHVAASIAHGRAARWGDAWLIAQQSELSSAARSMVLIGDPALMP